MQHNAQSTLLHPHAILEWQQCSSLPVGMFNARAVVLNTKVYVGGGCFCTPKGEENIYAYNPIADTWEMFQGPIRYSALAVYKNKLLLVGGLRKSTVTNRLWVYEGEQTWTQPLPPMPTSRCAASAVVYQEYIIVAGGLHDLTDRHLDTVEVFNGLQWSTTDPLPYGSCFMKATVHDGYYYLMGGNEQSSMPHCRNSSGSLHIYTTTGGHYKRWLLQFFK